MSLRYHYALRKTLISTFTAAIFLTGFNVSAAQESETSASTQQGAEQAEVTPLTAAEIETLFQHPRLSGFVRAEYTNAEMVNIKSIIDKSDAFFATLTPQTGEIKLASAGVTLSINEGYYFLDRKDSRKILEDNWNNPEDSSVLGMIFADGTNQDFYEYAIEVNFEKTGYVSDDDAAEIDYDDLLKTMQKSTRDANPQRIKLGYATAKLEGWAAEPKYDQANHRLHWAKLINFDDTETNTLNYNLRFLGRKGVLQFNFIADEAGLSAVNTDLAEVAKIASFDPGNAYSDFNATTDKVAKYGLTGLIAGGIVAKKFGLIGVALLFLKKGWFLILGAFALIGRFFKRKES